MSTFRYKIKSKFCITCELSPPRGPNSQEYELRIRDVVGRVDAINVTDNPMLSVRMSSVVASYICVRNGAEPIMHMTCRDRNVLAITSDLISAYSLGVENILVLRGDTPGNGGPVGVFELNVAEFLRLIRKLNEGMDFRGNQLNSRCDFFPGAALNPFEDEPRLRENLAEKLEAGAKFFQTQPILDADVIEGFAKIVDDYKADVLVGIMIVASERTLERMKNLAKGMSVPSKLSENILRLEKKEDKEKFGLEFSLELIDKIRSWGVFKGVHIYSPANEGLIPKLLDLIQKS